MTWLCVVYVTQFSQCILIHVLSLATNPCGSNNGGCQQICVLSHRTDNGGLGYRCKCEFGFELDADEHHCVGKKSSLPFTVFLVNIPWFMCPRFCPGLTIDWTLLCKKGTAFSVFRTIGELRFLFALCSGLEIFPFYHYKLLARTFRFYMIRFKLLSISTFLFRLAWNSWPSCLSIMTWSGGPPFGVLHISSSSHLCWGWNPGSCALPVTLLSPLYMLP